MKPIAVGLGLFVAAQAAYLTLVAAVNTLPPAVIWLPYFAAMLCAAATGYLAKSRRFVQVSVLAVLMAIVLGMSNIIWTSLGLPADIHGLAGALVVGGMSLPFILVLAIVGGYIGGAFHGGART